MRIQFLSNFYPPAARGGYELWCQEVAQGLQARGHSIEILTSTFNLRRLPSGEQGWIRRELYLEMEISSLRNSLVFFITRKSREAENLKILRDQISSHKPDFLLIWGMWNLPRSLPALAEQLMPGRVVYYMGDYWPTLPSQFEYYWQSEPRSPAARLPKRFLKFAAQRILDREERPALLFEHVLFPTTFMRDELERRNIRPQNSKIIYGGVDISPYRSAADQHETPRSGSAQLLFTGRLTPEKGVETALEAVGRLIHIEGMQAIKLSVVGAGETDYEDRLKEIVRRERIEPYVAFLGSKTTAEMPAIYRQADIFLFTSIWAEPFGRVLVEAMASGLAVVGTAVGGAAEILIDNENSLLFPPGDAAELAGQIKKLVEAPTLRQRLAQNGYRRAVDLFDSHHMVEGIEAYLLHLIQ